MFKSPLILTTSSGIEECRPQHATQFLCVLWAGVGPAVFRRSWFSSVLVLLVSSILLGSYNLCESLSTWFPEPWGEDWTETSHLGLSSPSSLALCTLSGWGSAATVFVPISDDS